MAEMIEEIKEAMLSATAYDLFWAFVRASPWIILGILINFGYHALSTRRKFRKKPPRWYVDQINGEISIINDKIREAKVNNDLKQLGRLRSMRRKLYHQIGRSDPTDDI